MKIFSFVYFVSLFIGMPTMLNAEPADLTLDDIIILSEKLDSSQRKDSFTKSANQKDYNGKKFSFLLDVTESSSGAVWKYEADSQQFFVFLHATFVKKDLNYIGDGVFGFPILSRTNTTKASYSGDTIKSIYDKVDGEVLILGQQTDSISKNSGLIYKVQLSPDEARLLTKSLAMNVSGNIVALDDDKVKHCSSKQQDPNPNQLYYHSLRTCAISVIFSKLELIDKSNGEVIHRFEIR